MHLKKIKKILTSKSWSSFKMTQIFDLSESHKLLLLQLKQFSELLFFFRKFQFHWVELGDNFGDPGTERIFLRTLLKSISKAPGIFSRLFWVSTLNFNWDCLEKSWERREPKQKRENGGVSIPAVQQRKWNPMDF